MSASGFIKNRRFCGGFTMVELIMVVVIAGILAAVAIPRLVGRNSYDVRGFGDQLAATVRFAQKLAISQGTETNVYVQLTVTDVTLCFIATVPCPAASYAPGPGGEKPYTVTAPSGVTIATPATVVDFNAAGTPVGLVGPLDIKVNGVGTYDVWVEQVTGYVHD